MSHKPTGRQIAAALGLSPGRISQLRRDGMDCTSVAAAQAWYARRVDLARSFGQRNAVPRPREPATQHAPTGASAAFARAEALAETAHYALAAGRFAELEAELRAALRAVAVAERPRLSVPMDVFRELVRTVFESFKKSEAPGDFVEGPMPAEEARWMGRFWYCVASGEVRVSDPDA